MRKHKEEVRNFFRKRSLTHDGYYVPQALYHVLSNEVLWSLLRQYIPWGGALLDAGGGTGTWAIRAVKTQKCRAVIFDLSKDMVFSAKANVERNGLGRWIDVVNGDLERLVFQKGIFDCVISLHNVLSLCSNAGKALKEMVRVVKKNGSVVVMTANIYHGFYYFVQNVDKEGIQNLKRCRWAKWKENIPSMRFYTPTELKELYRKCGIKVDKVLGFPIFIYPYEGNTVPGSTDKETKRILGKPDFFKLVYEVEHIYCQETEAASRGCYLIAFGRKE